MSLKFCPECGSPLAEGQLRCENCGGCLEEWVSGGITRLEAQQEGEGSETPEEDGGEGEAPEQGSPGSGEEGAQAEEREASDERVPDAGPIDLIGPSDVMRPLPMDVSRPERHLTDDWSHDRRIIAALGGIVLAVLVIVPLVMGSCHVSFNDPQASHVVPGGYREDGEQKVQPAKGDEGQGQPSGPEESESPEEQHAHDLARELLGTLDGLAQRVSAGEQVFEDRYLSESWQERADASTEADELAQELREAYAAAEQTKIDPGSKYYDQFLLLLRCHWDLVERMDLVQRLWERDLWYTRPDLHVEEIRQPRYESIDEGQADTRARLDFARNYAQISL